MELDLHHFTTL